MVQLGEELMHWLTAGGLLTVLGMVLVFAVLIILILVITMFGKAMTAGQKKPKVKIEKPVEVAPVIVNSAPVAPAASADDDELIAVIAAAVDAIYSGSGKKAIIRNIRPSANGGGRSAWATAGVLQNVKAF